MKKYFEYLGLIALVCFSFFITEQTVTVVQEIDEIMIQIKNNYLSYTMVGEDAVLNTDEMVPGLVTKKVNLNKSYKLMKEKGIYDSNFYIYDLISPNISAQNIFDKKIVFGNKKKKMVSFVFVIENNSIDKLLQNGLPLNIVIESYNVDKIINFKKNNNINILVDSTNEENLELINQKLKSINLNLNYCYKELSNWCVKNKIHVIKEKEVIEKNALLTVKKRLATENIFVFKLNDAVLKELPNIVQYVTSRGYTVSLLTEHLSENW